MPNYEAGKIYKMVCNETGCIYIGSTTQPISKRIASHKTKYKIYLNDNTKDYYSSFKIVEKNNFHYEVLENYKCCSKKELESREREYIDEYKVIYENLLVNKYVPTRSSKEWYADNRDHLLEKHKEYYLNNKDTISEKTKVRRANETEEKRLARNKNDRESRARRKAAAQALISES